MQRPEAWPRPHPGEGAAAAQAGGPAPPARVGEPAGLRVRSRQAPGFGAAGAGPGWGGGRQLTARAPARGNLGAPADLPGSGPGAGQGRKSSPGADPRGGRARVRVGLKFWISLEWPWARLGVGGAGVDRGSAASGEEWRGRPGLELHGGWADVRGFWSSPLPGPGGWGRAKSAGPASARRPLEGGGSAPLSPRPRFCDTLRLGLWSSQCMTELGPGRTFCTQWAQRPPGACGGTSAWERSRHRSWPVRHRGGPEPAVDLWGRWTLRMASWGQQMP